MTAADPAPQQPNPAFNVYTGSDIGYLKSVSFGTKTFCNLNTVINKKKELGISCMCWGKEDESIIYAGCRGGDIIYHDIATRVNQSVDFKLDENDYTVKGNELKQICVCDDNMITAFQKGSLYIHKTCVEDGLSISASEIQHLKSIPDATDKTLQCMDHNKSLTHMLATGGKENPLRIWDINDLQMEPIFTAKNVRNDWLSLRVPVWVTQAKFCSDGNKIITGTGYGKIRVYDPSTPQRRPVIEFQCEENPVTALALRPNSDFQVYAGNTLGTLVAVDLRKKAIVKAYKGNKGGITDIKFHSELPLFAVSSVDRYVRCYDPDQKTSLLHSLYLNSSLNCILFSSIWEKKDSGDKLDNTKSATKGKGSDESSQNEDSDGEEDLWKNMEEVKTKKRRLK